MIDYYCLGVLLYEMLSGLPPFYDSNKTMMYQKILNTYPKYSSNFSESAKDILSKLLEKDPTKRIGYKYGHKEI